MSTAKKKSGNDGEWFNEQCRDMKGTYRDVKLQIAHIVITKRSSI